MAPSTAVLMGYGAGRRRTGHKARCSASCGEQPLTLAKREPLEAGVEGHGAQPLENMVRVDHESAIMLKLTTTTPLKRGSIRKRELES